MTDTATEREATIVDALCRFHAAVPKIEKLAKAQYGDYADLASVLSAVNPVLAANGLAVVQTFQHVEGRPILRTSLMHTSGESVSSELPIPESGNRNVLHGLGGAITYLRRYSLLAILGLCADIDDDGASANPTPARATRVVKAKPQVREPEALEPWDSVEHAREALKICESMDELRRWAAKTKVSKFQGFDRDDLLAAYTEKAKGAEQKGLAGFSERVGP